MELFFNKNYRDKLNSDSKILYGFLLNRLTLSAKNNWIDENGNVFLIFTRKEVQERLDLSDKTVTKAFKQLKVCKLIHEKRQGANKPNLIYDGKIDHDEDLIKLIRNGYTLPSNFTKKVGIEKVRVYLACENVWYWSKRQGFDPRYSYSGATSQATYSPVRTISGGINIQF